MAYCVLKIKLKIGVTLKNQRLSMEGIHWDSKVYAILRILRKSLYFPLDFQYDGSRKRAIPHWGCVLDPF